jgi:hypothetical protein
MYKFIKYALLPFNTLLLLLFFITASISAQTIPHGSGTQPQWVILTEQAKKEITEHNFNKAYMLVQNAIRLNPSYQEAKELYFSLYEILEREKPAAQKQTSVKNEIPVVLQKQPSLVIINKPETVKTEPETQPAAHANDEAGLNNRISFNLYNPSIRTGILYTQTSSNYLNFVNSNTTLTGIRAEAAAFFTRSQPAFGVSLEYSGAYKKMSGSEDILFTVHRLNATLPFKITFLAERDRGLDLTIKPGIHYFILNNRKAYGVYYYRRILGPAAGLIVSDPLFSRIAYNSYTEPFGVEGILNFVKLFGQADAPTIMEYGAALTFDYDRYKIRSRYARYTISNGSIIEKYSDTSIDVQIKF